jgi:hypothetical protein
MNLLYNGHDNHLITKTSNDTIHFSHRNNAKDKISFVNFLLIGVRKITLQTGT